MVYIKPRREGSEFALVSIQRSDVELHIIRLADVEDEMTKRRITFVGVAFIIGTTAFALAAAARVQQIEPTVAPSFEYSRSISDGCFSGIRSFREARHRMRDLPPPGFRICGWPRPLESTGSVGMGPKRVDPLEGRDPRREAQFTNDSQCRLQRRR